jgi:hypothetical protein
LVFEREQAEVDYENAMSDYKEGAICAR